MNASSVRKIITRSSSKKPGLYEKDPRSHHHKRARNLKIASIAVTFLFLIASAITIWLWYDHSHNGSTIGINYLRSALDSTTSSSKLQTIRSSEGFKVTYNTNVIQANGLVFPGITTNPKLYASGNGPIDIYNGNSLNTERAYASLDFWTIDSEKNFSSSLDLNPVFQMQLTTNLQSDIMSQGHKLYPKDSDLQIAVKIFAPTTETSSYDTVVPSFISQSETNIGKVTYEKVVYKMTDTTFKPSSYYEDQYVTVQNGRPYEIEQDIDPTTTAGDIALLNQVIYDISYSKPDSKELIGFGPISLALATGAMINTSSKTTGLDNSINLPSQLSNQDLKITADNQPAVVRVGTIACFNFNLLLPNGQIAQSIINACGGGSGSGSIVSSNGYIGTNGHVIDLSPQDAFELYLELAINNENAQVLQKYLQYLVDSNVATAAQINALISAIESGNNNALQTLLNLTGYIPTSDFQIISKKTSYAIQLSNDPIKYSTSGTTLSFIYTKNVVPASYIDSNYVPVTDGEINLENYSGTDVALLKIKGNDFPVIQLGSLSNAQYGTGLTAVGWPGFVDGGLATTKTHTIPTATAGSVLQIINEVSSTYKIILTSIPIAEGNSGGPALNSEGLEVGLTTYSVSSANPNAGVTEESSGGILRNIDDFKALLTKNNISLNTTSQVSAIWNEAVNDFSIGDFKDADRLSGEIEKLYPDNYLAFTLEAVAKQQVAEGHGSSGGGGSAAIIGVFISIVLVAIAIAIIVILINHRNHGKRMGYYEPYMPSATLPGQAMMTPVNINQQAFQPPTMNYQPQQPSMVPQTPTVQTMTQVETVPTTVITPPFQQTNPQQVVPQNIENGQDTVNNPPPPIA